MGAVGGGTRGGDRRKGGWCGEEGGVGRRGWECYCSCNSGTATGRASVKRARVYATRHGHAPVCPCVRAVCLWVMHSSGSLDPMPPTPSSAAALPLATQEARLGGGRRTGFGGAAGRERARRGHALALVTRRNRSVRGGWTRRGKQVPPGGPAPSCVQSLLRNSWSRDMDFLLASALLAPPYTLCSLLRTTRPSSPQRHSKGMGFM